MRKKKLVSEVLRFFDMHDVEYIKYSGCFDFIVKADSVYAVKILWNIDAFQEEYATNLKLLARSMGVAPIIVGVRTNKEGLRDTVLYKRFGIFAMSVKTFKNIILHKEVPYMFRDRRGLHVFVDSKLLRVERKKKLLTQELLAVTSGISKKSIYEHEQKDMFMLAPTYKSIKKAIDKDVFKPIPLNCSEVNKQTKPTPFELMVSRCLKKIGFSIDVIHYSPFNIIAKSSHMIISNAENKKTKIEKNIPYIQSVSSLLNHSSLLITEDENAYELPTLTINQLSEIEDEKSLIKFIKKW